MQNIPGKSKVPKAVSDCHRFLKWLIPQLDKFPRSRRFTLGERIESGMLEILECLIEASYVRNKAGLLQRANSRLDVQRHLWRLCYELEVISVRAYEHGALQLLDLGRQMGAWRKSINA